MRTLTARCLALACGMVLAGCFEAAVHSGRPPGSVADGHDRRWHHGFLLGLAEASGPYDLGALCPGGWSELHTESDALQMLVALLTLGIYTPQKVTVVCAAPPEEAASPPDPLRGFH